MSAASLTTLTSSSPPISSSKSCSANRPNSASSRNRSTRPADGADVPPMTPSSSRAEAPSPWPPRARLLQSPGPSAVSGDVSRPAHGAPSAGALAMAPPEDPRFGTTVVLTWGINPILRGCHTMGHRCEPNHLLLARPPCPVLYLWRRVVGRPPVRPPSEMRSCCPSLHPPTPNRPSQEKRPPIPETMVRRRPNPRP